ncbi:hypothetical protein SEPCBS57363_005597 [Sporothrix epigloea]|uniref:Uncharacterized protein n=1 Tax=Sporothrix epigloea TaxID=1892477 RepID=A0ABP0DZM8_9PEZI
MVAAATQIRPDASADLTMDALKSLIANIPDWIKRLDGLSSQIDQRQRELARFVEPGAASPSSNAAATPPRTKPIRNKGSTESLKPQDEAATWQDIKAAAEVEATSAKAVTADMKHSQIPAITTTVSPLTGAIIGGQPKTLLSGEIVQVAGLAQARAHASLQKHAKRSGSIVSVEGVPKYRTRSMVIVYYDSYLQSFFEELVRFISTQRNLMRKAKMAARVAQIKRLVELEMPTESSSIGAGAEEAKPPQARLSATNPSHELIMATDEPIVAESALEADYSIPGAITAGDDSDPSDEAELSLPQLNFRRTLNMRSPGLIATGRPMYLRASARNRQTSGGGIAAGGARGMSLTGSQQPPDVFDELDRGLEYVQSTCEHAAHQFLRDGDCNDEISNIKRRLIETKEQADREMERLEKEAAEAPQFLQPTIKARSFRPQSMRRDAAAIAASTKGTYRNAPVTPGPIVADPIEAEAVLDVDEGIEDMDIEIPTLTFKSSRR